jgi:hypothetical protein
VARTRKLDVLVASVVSGDARAETASKAKVSERTLRRVLNEPATSVAIGQARVAMFEQMVEVLD